VRGPRSRREWLAAGLVAGLFWSAVSAAELTSIKAAGGPTVEELVLAAVLFACFPLAAFLPITAMAVSVLVTPWAAITHSTAVGGAQLIAELALVAHAAYRSPPRRSLVGAVGAAVVPALSLLLVGETGWEFVFFGVLVALGWALGYLLRREQQRSRQLTALADALAAEREANARAAVDAERARISRELHDAVAHTVSVMTMQAGVLRRRLADRPVERDALAQVEELGRRSVEEIRRVVGLLRPDEHDDRLAPPPSLRHLDDLVAQVRSTGLAVHLAVEGEPVDLPAGLDMSAYRIAQEALTNVLRHAAATRADVRVAYRAGEVGVTVTDDGTGSGGAPAPGGHGLLGMRERVALFGGALRTGDRDGGGYEVAATFPLAGAVG
jgi:signal transduction histidine kinase